MHHSVRPYAVVTGASSATGLELAKCCVAAGHDVLVVDGDRSIHEVAAALARLGGRVESVQVDLSTTAGIDELCASTGRRPVDVLLAHAGRTLRRPFVEESWNDVRCAIDTNVTGTLYLIHKVARDMRLRRSGRILVTGSMAGDAQGSRHAVFDGTKALLDSFAGALRTEMQEWGVSVTCLMPGQSEIPKDVAQLAFDAMMRGDADIVAGWQNRVRAAMARVAS